MIPTTGQTVNLNQAETVQAWADIVIKIWEDKIVQLQIYDTRTLLNSFAVHVQQAAGGRVDYIMFAFQNYGRFVDMGVGKDMPIGNRKTEQFWDAREASGRLHRKKRVPRPWYSPTFYSQLIKLSEIMAEKYAIKASVVIMQHADDNPTISFT